MDEVIKKINTFNLQAIQLHGHESPEYCNVLKRHYEERNDVITSKKETDCNDLEKKSGNDDKRTSVISSAVEIIKVFSIRNEFNFEVLKAYEDVCDYFLFDTKGKLPGGNGYTFDWNVLNNYPSTKPFFLSGGIGIDQIDSVLSFLRRRESKYCYAIDVNSKFEIEPGLKNVENIKEFKQRLSFRT